MLAHLPRRSAFLAFLVVAIGLAWLPSAWAQCPPAHYVQASTSAPCGDPPPGGQCTTCSAAVGPLNVPLNCWPVANAPTATLCGGGSINCTGAGCLTSVTYSACCAGERPNQSQTPPSCPTRLQFPRFNQNFGTLQKVEYWSRVQVTQVLLRFTNTSTTQGCDLGGGSYNLTGQIFDPLVTLDASCTTASPGMFPGPGALFSATLPAGTTIGPGAPPLEIDLLATGAVQPFFSSSVVCRTPATPGFQDTTGACDVRFTPRFLANNSFATQCPNVIVEVITRTRVEAFLTYWFCRTPPVAVCDRLDVCAGVAGTVNVLANDTLGNGSPVTAGTINCGSLTIVNQGTRGVATIVPCPPGSLPCINNCIRYTPNAGQPPGTAPVRDTFTYRFTDSFGCTSNIGSVEVFLHPNPVVPNRTADTCRGIAVTTEVLCGTTLASAATFTGTCLTPSMVNIAAATLNCDSLTLVAPQPTAAQGTVSIVSCPPGTCAGGGAFPCPTRCIRFTPTATFTGVVSIGYRIADNFGCLGTGTLTVNVRTPPTANPDPACTCHPNPVLIDVLSNDTAAAGRTLNRCSLTVTGAPTYGTAVVVGSTTPPCTGNQIQYTPPAAFVGTGRSFVDTFTYSITDSNNCTSTATVTVTVYLTPQANDDPAMVDTSTPDYPPISISLFDNDFPNPLPASIVASIIEQPDGTKGTLVSFNPLTGVAVYDPLPTFTGEDTFRYRLCNPTPAACAAPCPPPTAPACTGCCSEATVTIRIIPPCPELNRRNPGSLLIFPIFDNRQGNLTMVTVTNTNCDFTPGPGTLFAGTVDLKYYYVGKYGLNGEDLGCLAANRTRRLSPCDTITVWTSADNPNQSLGYLYVYAISPTTGQPIVFNHLIGQEIFLEGPTGHDDAVNAIIYRGIGSPTGGDPRPTGTLTNLDGDAHRDLDGREYDLSPNRILIPRFLGQDPPGGMFRSRLILLALSGGIQFNTNLNLLIYNDNEVVQSANLSFRCWDLRYLTDISGGFANDFLRALGDNPEEILGSPTRESGWLRLDGDIAFSTQAQILDPAFWAVLIEDVPPRPVIDLPWEECVPGQAVQDNGDLLPTGALGDY